MLPLSLGIANVRNALRDIRSVTVEMQHSRCGERFVRILTDEPFGKLTDCVRLSAVSNVERLPRWARVSGSPAVDLPGGGGRHA